MRRTAHIDIIFPAQHEECSIQNVRAYIDPVHIGDHSSRSFNLISETVADFKKLRHLQGAEIYTEGFETGLEIPCAGGNKVPIRAKFWGRCRLVILVKKVTSYFRKAW